MSGEISNVNFNVRSLLAQVLVSSKGKSCQEVSDNCIRDAGVKGGKLLVAIRVRFPSEGLCFMELIHLEKLYSYELYRKSSVIE